MVLVIEKDDHIDFVCGLILMYELMKKIAGSRLSENDERLVKELLEMVDSEHKYHAELIMMGIDKDLRERFGVKK